MRILLLGFGSRGDVQPLLALGNGLQTAGYDITLAAGSDFQEMVEAAGLKYAAFRSNMEALVNTEAGKDWINNSSDNPLREARNMRTMINSVAEEVTADVLEVTKDADVLVSGLPMFMAAQAIAEKYNKRHITIQFVPFNPTREGRSTIQPTFPERYTLLNKLSGYIGQYFTHWIFKDVTNTFRKQAGLKGMSYWDYVRTYNREVPVIYGLSQHVMPKPNDWDSNKYVTGYWFYDAPSDWQPSEALCDFLQSGDKPVYVGFGSMSNSDPQATTQLVVNALQQAGKRGIIYSGWAGLSSDNLPDDIFMLDYAPHDWLFPQMAGVVHHGGAGTTAAGIRAGVPATVVSHMADQPYWGRRVQELGIGSEFIRRHELTSEKLASAIHEMTTSAKIAQNATELGEKVRAEDGVANAIAVFNEILNPA